MALLSATERSKLSLDPETAENPVRAIRELVDFATLAALRNCFRASADRANEFGAKTKLFAIGFPRRRGV